MGRPVPVLLFALLCLLWGSTWMVIKVGYGGLGPFNVASLRFLVAGALLLAVAPAMRVPLPRTRREWRVVGIVGVVLFAADYGLIYWGEQWLESGLTAILFATLPVQTLFVAHAFLPEDRVTPRKLGGALVAFLGVATLFGDSLRLDAGRAWPMAAIVLSATCAAFASVATKRDGTHLHPVALNGPAMLLGAAVLAVASLAAGDGYALPRDGGTWSAVLYLAIVGSVVTFLVFFRLLQTWQATTLSYIAIFTPVVAVALGLVLLDERITPWTGAGAALVLGGVALALGRSRATAPPAPADEP